MKVTKAKLCWIAICSAALAPGFTWAIAGRAAPQAASPSNHFFPVAVWYGGGKARAPMLEP
jgi:hypothetical protein